MLEVTLSFRFCYCLQHTVPALMAEAVKRSTAALLSLEMCFDRITVASHNGPIRRFKCPRSGRHVVQRHGNAQRAASGALLHVVIPCQWAMPHSSCEANQIFCPLRESTLAIRKPSSHDGTHIYSPHHSTRFSEVVKSFSCACGLAP